MTPFTISYPLYDADAVITVTLIIRGYQFITVNLHFKIHNDF